MKTKPPFRLAFPLASAIAALLAGSHAQAQQIYWLGTTNGNFNADNWTTPSGGAMVPALVPLNDDVLNFEPSQASFNDVAGSFTINNDLTLTGVGLAISDNSATGDFSISGNPISIGGSGIVSNVLTGTGTTLAFGGTGITLAAATSFNALFGALTINSPVDNGGNLLTVEGVGATSISGAITSGGGLTKINAGSLTLSSANTYTGQTTVTQGTVTAAAIDALGTGSALQVNGGTLGISTFNNTVGAVTLTSGSITGTTGVLTGSSFALESGTASAILAGSGSVTKTTAGSVTLSGANTFSGQLTVQNGTLSVATANNVSTNGPLGNSALPVILGNTGAQTGILSYTGGTVTSTKPFTMASGGTGSFNVATGGTNLTLSGVIDGGGVLSKSGSGTLTLSNTANTYSGGTIIDGGRLVASAALASLGTGSTDIVFNSSGQLQPFSGSSTRGIVINNNALAQIGGNGSYTFTGNVTGTGTTGAIVASAFNFGSNVFLNGTANTFEGRIIIGLGSGTGGQAFGVTVNSLADSASASGRILFNSQVTHASGSVFGYTGATPLVLANRQIELASATTNPTNGHQIRASGSVSTATLTINTDLIVSTGVPQTLALRGTNTGANTFAGIISNSTVVGTTPLAAAFTTTPTSTITLASVQGITVGASISGTGIAPGTTITVIDPITRVVTLSAPTNGTAGSLGQAMTVTGVLNPTSVLKTDAGTWTLPTNNTHSGGTTFTAGTLNINHAGALGTGTLTIGAGSFDNTSGSAITNANNNVIAWNGDATFTGTNSYNLGTGAVTLGGTRNITVNANTLTFGGDISGTNVQEIRKAGSGTMAFTSVNSGYLGKTSVQAGTLQISSIADYNSNSSLGAVASGDIQLGSGTTTGTLNYIGSGHSSNRTFTIGSNTATAGHTGGGRINVNGGDLTLTASTFNTAQATVNLARTLTLGGSGNGAIPGIIQNNSATGTVSLAKSDAGTWTLSGNNTYTGSTTISGGTLVAANVGALATTSGVSISSATGSGTLRLATDSPVTAFSVTGSSSNPGTIVSDRATAGAAITHALGTANFGVNTFSFTSGANVTSGTAGISFSAVTLGGGITGTTVLNPTTATLTIGTITAINASPKTLNLGGTNAGHSITGAISDGASIPVSLIKSDTSTWTLSGANTYTGGTTVSGGTLTLGVDDCLADTSNVVIGASILNLPSNVNDTVGTLDPSAAATINLGSGATIAFADSNAVDWTGGTLNITGTLNFSGGPSSSLRFGTTNAGLTPTQLGLISAPGWSSFALDADGYLTATFGGGPGPLDHFAITPNPIGTTQTVGTPISGITITAQDASNATVTSFTGTVTFGGTGGFTGTSASFTAGLLSGPLNVTPTISGSNLTFTVDDGASHTGSTTITTIQTQYQAWAGGGAFDADANGDGVKNGMAFLLGAANPNASALSLLPVVTQSGGNLTLSFNMLKPANRGSATLNVEHSSNLGISDPWTTVLVTDGNSGPTSGVTFTVTPGGGSTNGVVATISSSEAASGKLFGRLKSNP